MWKCSRCGETLPDEFDVCTRCSALRDVEADAADAKTDADPPQVDDEADDGDLDDDQADESDQPLTVASFATVMLRLLGVYFAAFGFIAIVEMIGHIVVQANKEGINHAVNRYTLDYWVHPVAELLVGSYFLVGGQWVFDKILMPIRRQPEDDGFED